jgi:hypothetical protein
MLKENEYWHFAAIKVGKSGKPHAELNLWKPEKKQRTILKGEENE